MSWVALSVECACVDDLTNGVSVISPRPILLGGGEGGHLKRWVMLAGQSRPSRAGEHQGQKSRSPAPFIHPCPHRILGLCLRLMPITADYEVSQNNPDIGTSTEGRSIGHVHDKSAPTGGRVSLFIGIIGRVRDKSAPTDFPGMSECST